MTARQMTEALFNAKPGESLDFAAKNLRDLDLSGLDFKRSRMAGADLYGVDLKSILRFIATVGCPQRLAVQLRELRRSLPEGLA